MNRFNDVTPEEATVICLALRECLPAWREARHDLIDRSIDIGKEDRAAAADFYEMAVDLGVRIISAEEIIRALN